MLDQASSVLGALVRLLRSVTAHSLVYHMHAREWAQAVWLPHECALST